MSGCGKNNSFTGYFGRASAAINYKSISTILGTGIFHTILFDRLPRSMGMGQFFNGLIFFIPTYCTGVNLDTSFLLCCGLGYIAFVVFMRCEFRHFIAGTI